MVLRQQPRTVKKEGAGIGLPYEVRHEMALMLDDPMCSLTVALHRYNKHIDMIGERVARLGVFPLPTR